MNTVNAAALAGLVVSAGVVFTQLERKVSRPDAVPNAAEQRIDKAFEVAAPLRPAALQKSQVSVKGDLSPIRCAGTFQTEFKSGCVVDTIDQSQAKPYIVLETRYRSSSILERVRSLHMAGLPEAHISSSATSP